MGQGDLPTPRGGPLRRRRDKRQLEQLAGASERDISLTAATAHVRVIEDQVEPTNRDPVAEEPDSTVDGPAPGRPGGFHVRPVPIDQPIGETSTTPPGS
jgi:hypothetical protein